MNTTIKKEEMKTLPQLVKGSFTYKLVVPAKVEEKIRYLLRKFPHTEWSGVLFYTHKGTFEDNDLVITCEDIYPMDLGNATYTEFKMSEDVASYMANNIELFDCNTSIVHSHHTMSSQFSGTDMQTLQIEGNDTNCFVSLIVNTAGTYSAKITRKIQTKSEITVKKLGTSYEFFGEGSKEVTHDNTETTKTIDKEVIEYFDLEVERNEVPNTLDYLDARFEEIERKKIRDKENQRAYSGQSLLDSYGEKKDRGFFETLHESRKQVNDFKEPTLFEKEDNTVPSKLANNKDTSFYDAYLSWIPDEKKIHTAVVHIITCNLIINPEKIDLRQWVTKHMTNVYKRIFGEESFNECGLEICNAFSEWKDFIIQHTLDYFNYNDAPDALMENDWDLVQSRVAQAILDELTEFKDINPYIKEYLEAISLYIDE